MGGERARKEKKESKMRFLQLSILFFFFHLVNFQPLTFIAH